MNMQQIRLLNNKSTNLGWDYSRPYQKLKYLVRDLLLTTFVRIWMFISSDKECMGNSTIHQAASRAVPGFHWAIPVEQKKSFNGVFTLPDTDTDFTFTDTGTDTDTMGLKPNCICVGVGVGMNTSTQFSTTHFLSVSVSASVSGGLNKP